MKKILVATNNKGKLKEIKKILKDYELLSLKDVNCEIEVEENGETFEENALKKAKEISEKTNMPCIADDSGLCIKEFDGWPGVYTARFLGEETTSRKRNEYILDKMKDIEENRDSSVVCVIAYYEKGNEIIVRGEIQGKISKQCKGDNGFGFDEIFELENGRTLAELSQEEKNKVSARKIALEKLKQKLYEEK